MGEAEPRWCRETPGGDFGVVHGGAMILHPPHRKSPPPPPAAMLMCSRGAHGPEHPSLTPAAPGGGLLGWRFGDDPLPLGRHHQQEGFPPSLHQHQVPGHAAHKEMRAGGPGPPPRGQGRRRRRAGRKERGSITPHRLHGGAHSQPQHSDTLAGGPGARAPAGTRAEGGSPLPAAAPPALGGGKRDPLPFLEPAAAI